MALARTVAVNFINILSTNDIRTKKCVCKMLMKLTPDLGEALNPFWDSNPRSFDRESRSSPLDHRFHDNFVVVESIVLRATVG